MGRSDRENLKTEIMHTPDVHPSAPSPTNSSHVPTVYLNGDLVPRTEAAISPDDRGFLFGDGVYEMIRCYRGRPFELDRHLARLANGVRELEIHGVRVGALPDTIDELIASNGLEGAEAVMYLQVTRGAAFRGHAFPDPPVPPTVYGWAAPFQSTLDRAAGVKAITHPDQRWTRCDIKTISLVANCLANQRAHEAGAFEAILVRDGVALEGSHASFLGVSRGTVLTGPLTNYVLPSVTREVVLELCREESIPVEVRPIFQNDLYGLDEIFFAGTTTEVLPVIEVDGRTVGAGRPGAVTLRLGKAFRRRTGQEA